MIFTLIIPKKAFVYIINLYIFFVEADFLPLSKLLKDTEQMTPNITEVSLMEQPNSVKGSNPGGLYTDITGTQFYVKFPYKRKWDGNPSGYATHGAQTFGQEMGNNAVKNEILAAKFYQLGGIRIPKLSLVEAKDEGCLGIASEIVHFKQYNQLNLSETNAVLTGEIPGLYEGFAFDAWLGCWDVYGTGGDNLGIVTYSDGRKEVMRIDVGGALEYRACGLLKGHPDGHKFAQDTVGEIDTLKEYNEVFQNIPEESIKRGVEKIAQISDEKIKKIIRDNGGPGDEVAQKRLAEKLIHRKRFLMNKYGIKPEIVTFNKDFSSLDSLEQQYKASAVAEPALNSIVPEAFETYLAQAEVKHNLYEPEFKDITGKQKSAGILIVEDDGRVWMYEPKNQFGGYHNTFPKGRLDGQEPQTAAIREAFEETGLQVEIVGYLGDFEKSTTNNRFYIAKRVGGVPFGWKGTDLQPSKQGEIEETKAVLLVNPNKLAELEKRNFGPAQGLDLPIVSKFLEVQKEAINLGGGSFFKGLKIIQQKAEEEAKDKAAAETEELQARADAATRDAEAAKAEAAVAKQARKAKEKTKASLDKVTANLSSALSSSYSGFKIAPTEINYYSEICRKHFDNKITKTKYIITETKPSKENDYTLGELRRSINTGDAATKEEVLAVIKYGSIECPKIEKRKGLIDEQYSAFVAFLKMESELAGDDPVTIKINDFSPEELQQFLEKLNDIDNIPNIILKLPNAAETCGYGDKQHYTKEQYDIAKLAVNEYNQKNQNNILKKETTDSDVSSEEVTNTKKFTR